MTLKRVALVLLFVAVSSLNTATAAALLDRDVFCNGVKCGNMQIDTYATFKNSVNGRTGGGVTINGMWTPVKPQIYHFLQVITTDQATIPFVDGTAITAPYVDTPPGGYQNQTFDRLPYYDQAGDIPAFPGFFDMPRTSSRRFDNLVGPPPFSLSTFFEAWVVCVISETYGANPNKASDDRFVVAPLFGFKWGYTYTWNGGDTNDPANFTVTALPLAEILGVGQGGPGPGAQWTAGLGQTYGTGAGADQFNVTIGACENCIMTPEPASANLAGSVLLIFAVWRVLKRKGPGATART